MILRVPTAQPHDPCETGGLGRASQMLFRQIDFPDEYDTDKDVVTGADHDRLEYQDGAHVKECLKLTGRGPMALGTWAKRASAKDVLHFCREILRADPALNWVGCRITGTVHRGNGYMVWTIWLFARGHGSTTKGYSGEDAPNVMHDDGGLLDSLTRCSQWQRTE